MNNNIYSRSIINRAEIFLLKGGIEDAAKRLSIDGDKRIGIVGGRWSGALKRLLLPRFPKTYVIEGKAFSDTSVIVGVGGEAAIERATVIAKRFNCELYVIMTTPALPPLSSRPKQLLAAGGAMADCGREVITECFASLALSAFLFADRQLSDLLNDTFSPPTLIQKAFAVISEAYSKLESKACGGNMRAYAIAEANLGIYAIASTLGMDEGFTHALRLFKGFCGETAREKAFLFGLVLTRYLMSRLYDEEDGFVPPPYMNGRLNRVMTNTGLDEKTLYKKFSQSSVDFKRIRPRLNEFNEDFADILNTADNFNLRALKILKRLRFDCGEKLSSLICYDEIKNALALIPELCTCPTFLTALRDRGDLDLLLA